MTLFQELTSWTGRQNEVHNRLVLMCEERNIPLLFHNKTIIMSKYLNGSKLYLNNHCLKTFAENFSRHLVKLKWHQKGKNNLTTPISLDSDNKCHNCDTPRKFAKKWNIQANYLRMWDLWISHPWYFWTL